MNPIPLSMNSEGRAELSGQGTDPHLFATAAEAWEYVEKNKVPHTVLTKMRLMAMAAREDWDPEGAKRDRLRMFGPTPKEESGPFAVSLSYDAASGKFTVVCERDVVLIFEARRIFKFADATDEDLAAVRLVEDGTELGSESLNCQVSLRGIVAGLLDLPADLRQKQIK